MNHIKNILWAGKPMLVQFFLQLFLQFGTGRDLYCVVPSIDNPMHFLGGCVTAFSVWRLYGLYEKIGQAKITPFLLLACVLVASAALAGILWETYEFTHDILFPGRLFQPSNKDTMGDLLLDILGGGVFAGIMWRQRKRKRGLS